MGLRTQPANSQGGDDRDTHDAARLRHGRDCHTGFAIGRHLQPAPMLFTRDGHNVFLGDMYRGQSVFLICAGPSLLNVDLQQLDQRGMMTMAVNNAAAVYRSQLWCSVDDPSHFVDAIWFDAGITKFVPLCHMEKPVYVRDDQQHLVASGFLVGDMPSVFGFRRNEAFVAEQWLFEDSFNWGNHSKRTDAYGHKGSRSIMYIALRLLFFLGFRRVFLLGCDFKMEDKASNYAFEQARSAASVRSNNSTYEIFNSRMSHLAPHFEREGFEIYNCTRPSGLKVFPFMSFEEAVRLSLNHMPRTIVTAGLYDSAAKAAPSTPSEPRVSTGRSVEAPAGLPALTLLVILNRDNVACFQRTWPTWLAARPWFRALPMLIAHQVDVPWDSAFCKTLPAGTRFVRFQRQDGVDSAVNRESELTSPIVDIASRFIQTEWYLKLDADAVATDDDPGWPNPDWFRSSGDSSLPTIIGHRWSYVLKSHVEALDAWASSVPSLAEGVPYYPDSRRNGARMKASSVSSWCLFVNSEWSRTITDWYHDGGPAVPYQLYLHYCTVRANKSLVALDMKRFGWNHSFGRSDAKTRLLCDEVLKPSIP